MASIVLLLMSSMLVFTLPRLTSSCQGRDKPLLLSPYLDFNQVEKARELSKVDRDCVEDFVPDSFTGFLTVDRELGNHMFFWFFPSTEDENAPLLLWLNGGPTVSSMLGLFWEHGPMELVVDKANAGGCKEKSKNSKKSCDKYRKREHPWTGPFSMLYVDNPVGTGFSFSDSGKEGERFTREGYTEDLASFMNEFVRLFPEYKERELYLGGQSYAGKYVISLAYEIHTRMQGGRSNVNLTGIYLGAPWFDAETQLKAAYDFAFNFGDMAEISRQDALEADRKFYERAKKENMTYQQVDEHNRNPVFFGYYLHSFNDNYVTRESTPYSGVQCLLTKSVNLRRAAHVGNLKFHSLNNELYSKFGIDSMFVSVKPQLAELMNVYKVLIYNGNYDGAVTLPSIEASLFTTPWDYQARYNSTKRSFWPGDNNVILGFYSRTHKFCRVVIDGAGHQVPHDKPQVTLHMMKQFVSHGCVRGRLHLNPQDDAGDDKKCSDSDSAAKTSHWAWTLLCVELVLYFSLGFLFGTGSRHGL